MRESQPKQSSLFDPSTGRELKRQGMARVEAHNLEWTKWMRGEAKRISHERGVVSANDLHPIADRAGRPPHHDNAWGPVFTEPGWIKVRLVYARRRQSHARQIWEWRWAR